jgi:hypothetical protein
MLRGADRADVGYKCWYREPVKITSESPTGGKKEALACRRRPALAHSSWLGAECEQRFAHAWSFIILILGAWLNILHSSAL